MTLFKSVHADENSITFDGDQKLSRPPYISVGDWFSFSRDLQTIHLESSIKTLIDYEKEASSGYITQVIEDEKDRMQEAVEEALTSSDVAYALKQVMVDAARKAFQ